MPTSISESMLESGLSDVCGGNRHKNSLSDLLEVATAVQEQVGN